MIRRQDVTKNNKEGVMLSRLILLIAGRNSLIFLKSSKLRLVALL